MKFFVLSGLVSALLIGSLQANAAPAREADAPPLTATAATELLNSLSPSAPWRPHPISLAPASWIWLPCQRTLPNTFVLFRKEVILDSAPSRAQGWITADSRYRLTVNGHRVQWGPAPCDPRAVDADPVDLKPFLVQGKNVIGVEVLFYGEGDGTWPGGKPGLLFNAAIETAGGKTISLLSDPTWLSRLDRSHQPGQYKRWYLRALQEDFDARLHPDGWDDAAYVPDDQWVRAQPLPCRADKPSGCGGGPWSGDTVDQVEAAAGSLRMRQIPLVTEQEISPLRLAESGRVAWVRSPDDWFDMRMPNCSNIDPKPITEMNSDGACVLPATPGQRQGVFATYEFKEQIVGFPYFTIDAPAGTVVELMIQEAHDPAVTHWLDTQFFSWSRFTCKEGINHFETFDFESLRWLQLHVHGASRPVTIRDVGVRRRSFAWPHEPLARCSEPGLQRLFAAGLNTLSNSAIESIVDGMARERQQYSGDGGHQLHAIRYAFGEPRICARYLRTFSEGLAVDGYFMDCWPAYDRLARVRQKEVNASYWGPILDHGVGFVFDNFNNYMETGDLGATAEAYPRLVRFAEYLQTIRDQNGLLKVEGLGIPVVWMDHQAYARQAHKQCSFNLYAAAMYMRALAPLADAFGDAPAAQKYRQLGQQLLDATIRRYWSKERRLFIDNLPWLGQGEGPRLSDRTLAMSVLFDQCPAGDTAAAIKALAECPGEMGFSYPCNAGWRLWALAKGGRINTVLGDLRTRWAGMRSVRENNTLQEDWNAATDSGSQWSHCPLAPLYVLHQDIAGIRPLEPGFKRVRIRPQLGDLPDLELASYTPQGPIQFKSVKTDFGHTIHLTLPPGCAGELWLPSGSIVALASLASDAATGLKRYEMPQGMDLTFDLRAN